MKARTTGEAIETFPELRTEPVMVTKALGRAMVGERLVSDTVAESDAVDAAATGVAVIAQTLGIDATAGNTNLTQAGGGGDASRSTRRWYPGCAVRSRLARQALPGRLGDPPFIGEGEVRLDIQQGKPRHVDGLPRHRGRPRC